MILAKIDNNASFSNQFSPTSIDVALFHDLNRDESNNVWNLLKASKSVDRLN